jgi:glyoxylase-like metal-dependent hydrolase (beta-lactamase superfamily II)
MRVNVFPLGPLDTNCFLIHSDTEAVAVDVGGDPGRVLNYLSDNKLALTHILLTHLHFDHTYGVRDLAAATGAATLASEKDRYMLDSELGHGGMWGLPTVPPYTFDDLQPGALTLLGAECKVLATPGHTPGGLSFHFPELRAVFAGDCLFYRSVGRTDFVGGDTDTLMRSIREQLFSLPDETTVYPGHGQSTSVGDEKRNNPYASDFRML